MSVWYTTSLQNTVAYCLWTVTMEAGRYTVVVMPRVSRLKPAPIPRGDESLGQRLYGPGDHHRRTATAWRPKPVRKPSRRVSRRLERIEALPSPRQMVLLKTIDTFLENAAFEAARR